MSLIVSPLVYVAAVNTEGKISDLLVNLCASIITVALTVILVDNLRTSHLGKINAVPKAQLIRNIKAANQALILDLGGNQKDNTQFLREFIGSAQKEVDSTESAMALMAKYAGLMSKVSPVNLLAQYDQTKLDRLKSYLESVLKELETSSTRYEFSIDPEFKSKLADLIEKCEAAVQVYSVLGIDDATWRKLTTKSMPKSEFVAITLIVYLKAYVEFLRIYDTK